MQNQLNKIFSLGYHQYKGQGTTTGTDVHGQIASIKDEISVFASKYKVSTDYSIGVGRWCAVPWIRLFYQSYSPSAQEGVYIVYLFSANESAVYLTLNQGVTNSSDTYIKSLREKIQSKVDSYGFEKSNGLLDFGDGKGYGKSTIFFKKYSSSYIPDDDSLKTDINQMLKIYEDCKNKGLLNKKQFFEKEAGKMNSINKSIPETAIISEKKKEETYFVVSEPLQQIFFGAPGTGKSFKVNQKAPKDEKVTFRTTFHPDYDYAQFVGAYKPKKENGTITYSFVPQVFAKAYVAAWKNYLEDRENPKPVYLVIEEINRGNCAQIFGDIFQLLDRNESGESQYEIDVDSDFAEWLGESKIKLPPNFNILATMNTSDQSLFPMDSAFKRRFDWEYVPISFEGKSAANFQIEIGSSENVKYYSWQTFVEKVNAKILDLTESEDKQLGEYFIQPDKKLNDSDTEKTVISEERFKGKVMFYLWNEICKDEHKNGSFFKIENDFFTFQDLYKDDSKLAAFMEEIEKTGKN